MQFVSLGTFAKATIVILAISADSLAASATEKLQDCLKTSISESETSTMVRWMTSMISAYPGTVSKPIFSPHELDEIDRSMAFITTRLSTQACKRETIEAMAQDKNAIKIAYGALTREAVSVIYSSIEVQRRAQSYTQFIDMEYIGNALKK